jgi:hypothetical protein
MPPSRVKCVNLRRRGEGQIQTESGQEVAASIGYATITVGAVEPTYVTEKGAIKPGGESESGSVLKKLISESALDSHNDHESAPVG